MVLPDSHERYSLMSTIDKNPPHFPLKISLTEMNERTRALIEYYIERSNKRVFSLADSADTTEVILADFDHPGAASRLTTLKRRDNCVLIALAVGERKIDGAIVVRKPLDSAGLEQAATEALAQLTQLRQNPQASADPSDSVKPISDAHAQDSAATLEPAETPTYFRTADATRTGALVLPIEDRIERYKAKMHLLCGPSRTLAELRSPDSPDHRFDADYCLGRRAARILFKPPPDVKAVQINLADAEIYLFPALRSVYSSVSLEIARNVQNIFKDEVNGVVTELNYTSENVNELVDVLNRSRKHSFSAQSFCWLSALFSASGRLPSGFDLDTVCALKHWPNLTRLELIPHCLEIAAAWSDKPATLPDVVDKVGCEPRYAASFLYAATTINVMTHGSLDERYSDDR